MNAAKFAGHGGVMTPIAPHATGHKRAKDGTLLRVDCERGIGWVASRYDLNLCVIEQVRGPMRKYTTSRPAGHRARSSHEVGRCRQASGRARKGHPVERRAGLASTRRRARRTKDG